ncbi:MAG TPA: ABC transporter substrate-binding protein [Gammaproteobacteria bacterium]|nr:ABC transporter substrate-binding protein [Gammaproteobacteria bacterium]
MSILARLGRISAGVAFGLAVTASSVAAQETINIGFTGPLSGGAALYGKNALAGMEMAVNEMNATGGIEVDGKKYKLNIVTLDDKYSPAEAAINGRRLVQEHKTPIIFVPHFGGSAALQAFNESMDFLVAAYTTVPAITQRGNTLTVRLTSSYTDYMKAFSHIAMERYGKRVAIANGNHDYAKAWAAAFTEHWQEKGGEIVANNPMDYNKDADFYSGVGRVLAAKPDVIMVGGPSEPTALVIRQAREMGFKGGFIVMEQAKLDEMEKVTNSLRTLEGAVGIMPLATYGTPEAAAYVERFRKLYKKDAGSEAYVNYFGVYLMAEAMKHAGTVSDPKAIRAAIGKALETLPKEYNIYSMNTVDAGGGLEPEGVTVGAVVNGKVERARYLRESGK